MGDMVYRVRIQPSGHQFEVRTGETLLDAALRQGLALPYGCRNGSCGSCKGRVLSGQFQYTGGQRPPGLDAQEAANGLALFCQAMPGSDMSIEAREIHRVGDLPVKTLPCRAEQLRQAAHDVMVIQLKLPAAERLQFLAGQYLEILLKDGRRRAFSIANPPHEDACIELHIRHVEGGTFTDHVFADMKARTLLRIEGPFGNFFLREESDRPILLIGGGTGLAPLKSMIEHAFHVGLTRPMHLFWGVRARRDLYMDELPSRWAAEHAGFQYTPVLSQPRPEDAWPGETGTVVEAVLRRYPDLSGFDAYIAGPPAMCEAAREAFREQGLPEERMFSDAFEYAADSPATGSKS
ncbi:MAG: CDP-6-deoxy-delta-3,4-glucoseen reductase [Gammaproteobacteria bacterium]